MSKVIDKRQEVVRVDIDIEEEIERQYKLSSDDKKQIIKKVIFNYLIAILVMVYFILLIIGNRVLSKDIFVLGSKIADFVLLVATVVILEIAYKRDSGRITVHGIEILVVAIYSLFIPYIFYELSAPVKKYFMMAGVAVALYYIVKSIILYRLDKKKYIKSSNDIGEIIKKESKTAINFISSEIDDDGRTQDAPLQKEPKKAKEIKKEEQKKEKEVKEKEPKKEKETKKKEPKEAKEIKEKEPKIKKEMNKKETKKTNETAKRARHMKVDENIRKSGRHMKPEEKKIVEKSEDEIKKEQLMDKVEKMKKIEAEKQEEAPQYIVKKRNGKKQ